jgi:hypothetical protein
LNLVKFESACRIQLPHNAFLKLFYKSFKFIRPKVSVKCGDYELLGQHRAKRHEKLTEVAGPHKSILQCNKVSSSSIASTIGHDRVVSSDPTSTPHSSLNGFSYFVHFILYILPLPRSVLSVHGRSERNLHLLTNSMELSPLCSHSRTSQHFMKPEGSLPCSQEPSTGPCPEPHQSKPHPTIPSYLSKILRTLHVPNLISIFFRLGRLSMESVQVRGFLRIFVTSLFFTVRSC